MTAKIHLFFLFLAREGEKTDCKKMHFSHKRISAKKDYICFPFQKKMLEKVMSWTCLPFAHICAHLSKCACGSEGRVATTAAATVAASTLWYLRHPMRGNSPSFSFRTSPPQLSLLVARETSTGKFRHL